MRINETMTARWTKLSNGRGLGAQLRVGGRGAEYVGQQVPIVSKAGKRDLVTLGEIVKDWGEGDVVEFRVIR